MEQKTFILRNEQEVNVIVTRILLWSLFAFPIVLLLCKPFLGFFNASVHELVFPCLIGAICHFIPTLMRRLEFSSTKVKYTAIMMSAISIGIINANPYIWISIILIFPVLLSLLYFDKRLTFFAVLITLASMFVSQYFFDIYRAALGTLPGTFSAWRQYLLDAVTYLIEIGVVALISMMLTRRTRNLLESLKSSEEQAILLDKLKEIMVQTSRNSDVLADSVKHLSIVIDNTSEESHNVSQNASNAANTAKINLEYMEKTANTVQEVSTALETILTQAAEMADISKETYGAAVESEALIMEAVQKMEAIEISTAESKATMTRLGSRSSQIGKVVGMIAQITKQTNLLALNASIEASRAGEQGQGFRVIAQEIKNLSEQSTKATKDIAELIEHEQTDVSNAVGSIEKESETIKSGIGIVRTAGDSFEKLKQIQEESNRKAQDIAAFIHRIHDYGYEIIKIVTHVKASTVESQSEVESIMAAMEEQLSSMNQVTTSVETVDLIAEDLLKLSKSIQGIEA